MKVTFVTTSVNSGRALLSRFHFLRTPGQVELGKASLTRARPPGRNFGFGCVAFWVIRFSHFAQKKKKPRGAFGSGCCVYERVRSRDPLTRASGLEGLKVCNISQKRSFQIPQINYLLKKKRQKEVLL